MPDSVSSLITEQRFQSAGACVAVFGEPLALLEGFNGGNGLLSALTCRIGIQKAFFLQHGLDLLDHFALVSLMHDVGLGIAAHKLVIGGLVHLAGDGQFVALLKDAYGLTGNGAEKRSGSLFPSLVAGYTI